MRAISLGVVLFAVGVAAGQPDRVRRYEYRALTKDQLLELGKKDLVAGLNKLGDEGWELVAVEASWIFKRQRDQGRRSIEEINRRIALAEADLESQKDRVAWSERMARKGFLSQNQVEAERTQLRRVELALAQARRALGPLLPAPKEAADKAPPPEK